MQSFGFDFRRDIGGILARILAEYWREVFFAPISSSFWSIAVVNASLYSTCATTTVLRSIAKGRPTCRREEDVSARPEGQETTQTQGNHRASVAGLEHARETGRAHCMQYSRLVRKPSADENTPRGATAGRESRETGTNLPNHSVSGVETSCGKLEQVTEIIIGRKHALLRLLPLDFEGDIQNRIRGHYGIPWGSEKGCGTCFGVQMMLARNKKQGSLAQIEETKLGSGGEGYEG
ncbi:hypothetical protein B0H16DRAFT_1455865 [Mycena metata]|uniref:Uncharacterized protein n=1 Tax=Mycena metata TaxID=1033252 RepID=A0AAD7NGR4_9AGAR|nr:hypothetical protein B0H16DRAFT_1455865 [Mycena metata]